MKLDTTDRAFVLALAPPVVAVSALCAFTSPFLHGHTRPIPAHQYGAVGAVAALVILVFAGAGASALACDLVRRVRATRQLRMRFAALQATPPPELTQAAGRHRLTGRLMWLETHETIAVTIGFVRPRATISRGLYQALTPQELDAVLAHESHHVAHRDPLRSLLVRASSAALFHLPPARRLRDRYETCSELAADRTAIRGVGTQPVIHALDRILHHHDHHLAVAPPMGGSTALDARITQLEQGQPPATPLHADSALVMSLLIAAIATTEATVHVLGVSTHLGATALDTLAHLALLGPAIIATAFVTAHDARTDSWPRRGGRARPIGA